MTEDCLIIGAGVIGLSVAYELAVHGLSVRVIDRQAPGREASWAGAGILPPANRDTALHPLDQLRAFSHSLHRDWAARLQDETGIDNGFRQCGGIYLARTIGDAAALDGWAKTLHEQQIASARLAADSLLKLEPSLDCPIKAAYLLPDEAQLRNPRHLQALIVACERRGVVIEPDTELLGYETHGPRFDAVQSSRGNRRAKQFCLTAGAWTFGLLSQLGLTTGIFPMRGQMVLFRTPQPLLTRVVNDGPRYLVPRDDGRLLVGSTEEEVGFDKQTTPAGLDELRRLALELVPTLCTAKVEKTWAGLRPGTFDGLPYLGAIPGFDNAFVASGHFRSGLHLSPGTAVVMGELLRGLHPQIDLSPFRVGRG